MSYEAGTFRATATRDGKWYAVQVHGLPDSHSAWTQGRTLAECEAMAADLISLVLEVDPATVTVELHVEGTDSVLDEVARARRAREEAGRREQETLARAARDLTGRGLSQRDAARLLGVSHQRIAQLAPGHRTA